MTCVWGRWAGGWEFEGEGEGESWVLTVTTLRIWLDFRFHVLLF